MALTCMYAIYVLSTPQNTMKIDPATAPRVYNAAGIDKTPVANVILIMNTAAASHPTVRNFTAFPPSPPKTSASSDFGEIVPRPVSVSADVMLGGVLPIDDERDIDQC